MTNKAQNTQKVETSITPVNEAVAEIKGKYQKEIEQIQSNTELSKMEKTIEVEKLKLQHESDRLKEQLAREKDSEQFRLTMDKEIKELELKFEETKITMEVNKEITTQKIELVKSIFKTAVVAGLAGYAINEKSKVERHKAEYGEE